MKYIEKNDKEDEKSEKTNKYDNVLEALLW